ncbi:hypothetical protein [Dongshaea marina]|uniref:hypothetical protein n=1 Tax=Dongshaea marina TaxID=2047966 RepID=UPI000D3E6B8B|nr:hypothetical protein [Dongshaea marina]
MPRKDNQYMEVLFVCTFANLKHEDEANTGVSLGVKRVLDKQYPFPAAARQRQMYRWHKYFSPKDKVKARFVAIKNICSCYTQAADNTMFRHSTLHGTL